LNHLVIYSAVEFMGRCTVHIIGNVAYSSLMCLIHFN